MQIPNFPDYSLVDGVVINTLKNMPLSINKKNQVKMKHSDGTWKYRSIPSIHSALNLTLKLPKDFVVIPYTEGKYFINKESVIYGYTSKYPTGRILKPSLGKNYYTVIIYYKGRRRRVEVHQLMCVTFILEDYVERGLVCLHDDDIKTNCHLSNLSVGTYTQNNKDAYTTGMNPGNGL